MSRVLVPAAALPGFPQATSLLLEPVEGAWGLYMLSSPQVPELRLFVLESSVHLPEYTPRFSAEQLELVGSPKKWDRSIYVVINLADGQPSANLLAPLLVNTATGSCAQVILESQDWPLRHPLPIG